MSDANRLNVMIVPVTPFQQNCSLIWNESTKSGAVIDPGGDLDLIRQAIAKAGVRIERILLTHGHIDHAGGAADLRTELGVPLEGPHVADQFLLDNLEETAAVYGLSGARDVTPDRWLQEGEQVTIGGVPFDILHCPGHSPGSVAFVSRDLKFAVVGDVLFQGSIGRSDLPGGDHEMLIRSITGKLLPLGDDVAFICGHGPASTMGEERRSNPFLR
ncbi:MAG: MBL fold metallo-hydrolase [Pseudorhodoplanes sp.]|jgi:glyoxylase-like metal-dependent hydrolase (beta-lactamase superfamily II)|nr:MBL fold metallo-hydrolase [Pseudorhodoplanes sp.]